MRQGDIIYFDVQGEPHKATVASVLFTGTSKYIPDVNGEPWRELLIIESTGGALVLRDRMRVKADVVTSQDPTWHVGEREAVIDWLSDRVISTDGDELHLYSRALRALQKWAKAIEV